MIREGGWISFLVPSISPADWEGRGNRCGGGSPTSSSSAKSGKKNGKKVKRCVCGERDGSWAQPGPGDTFSYEANNRPLGD